MACTILVILELFRIMIATPRNNLLPLTTEMSLSESTFIFNLDDLDKYDNFPSLLQGDLAGIGASSIPQDEILLNIDDIYMNDTLSASLDGLEIRDSLSVRRMEKLKGIILSVDAGGWISDANITTDAPKAITVVEKQPRKVKRASKPQIYKPKGIRSNSPLPSRKGFFTTFNTRSVATFAKQATATASAKGKDSWTSLIASITSEASKKHSTKRFGFHRSMSTESTYSNDKEAPVRPLSANDDLK